MILNRYISLVITAFFFLFLMFLASSVVMTFLPGYLNTYVGIILIVVFFMISRSFYYYLRSDEMYKNTRKYSSDIKGEHYITKGENDIKKIFIIIWVLVMLIILSCTMFLIQ